MTKLECQNSVCIFVNFYKYNKIFGKDSTLFTSTYIYEQLSSTIKQKNISFEVDLLHIAL